MADFHLISERLQFLACILVTQSIQHGQLRLSFPQPEQTRFELLRLSDSARDTVQECDLRV